MSASRIAVLLAVAVCAVALPARADEETARQLFREGRELFKEGKIEQACQKFADSVEAHAAVGPLLNLARCHEQQGKIATAYAEYSQAAKMAEAAGQADRARIAADRAAELKPRLSSLTIKPSPVPGLVVKRNGVTVDPGSLGAPIVVDPGTHRIEAGAPGRQSWSAEVVVGDNADQQAVDVPQLEPQKPAAAKPAAKPVAAPPPVAAAKPAAATGAEEEGGFSWQTQHFISLAVGAVGLAGVVVGAVLGLQAMSQWDDANSPCGPPAEDPECGGSNAHDLSSEAKTSADISTTGFVVGGAALAAAVIIWFTAPADPEPSEVAVRLSPFAAPHAIGVTLTGRWQ